MSYTKNTFVASTKIESAKVNENFTSIEEALEATADLTTNPVSIDQTKTIDVTNNFYGSMARQAVINGNFDIWQRSVSQAISQTTHTFTADRWQDYADDDGGTAPTLTRSRSTLTAGSMFGAYYASTLTTNGAGTSLGNESYHSYIQGIEHGTRYLCGASKTVTISFYAKSSITNKKIGVYLDQTYGTGGTPTSAETITGTNWTLTTSWTKYTHTFTTNTLASKTFGTANDDCLNINFFIAWGSTYQANVGVSTAESYVGAGTIDIAQVQLCAGSTALKFNPKSFEDELRASQRYYEKSVIYTEPIASLGSIGRVIYPVSSIAANTLCRGDARWKVTKRTISTVHIYSPVTRTIDKIHCYDGADRDVTATISEQGDTGCRLDFTTPNNAGAATVFISYHWTAEAEL